MRLSLSSEGKETEKEVTADSIKGASIVFTPSTKLKKMLDNLEYNKV